MSRLADQSQINMVTKMGRVQIGASATTTGSTITTGQFTGTGTFVATAGKRDSASPQDAIKQKKIENAVYAHIRALRALGHTRVNSTDVAIALKVPHSAVERAVKSLTAKGIKVAR